MLQRMGQNESGIVTIITFCFIEERHICPIFNSMILVTEARIGFLKSFFDISDVWTNLGAHIWSFSFVILMVKPGSQDSRGMTGLSLSILRAPPGPLASLAPPLTPLSAFLVDVQHVNSCVSPPGSQALTLVKEKHKTLVTFEQVWAPKMILLGFFSLLYRLNVTEA